MEIMSLGFYLKVIYKSACKESCVSQHQQRKKCNFDARKNLIMY